MPQSDDLGITRSQGYSFTPLIMLEILRTFGSALMSSSVSNHLLIELGIKESVGSVVSSMFFFGFFFFTMFFGHASDKLGRRNVIILTEGISLFMAALSLIPITNTARLVLFAIYRFIDGGTNGVFWPTVQGYSIFAGRLGKEQKQKFLSGYNFGWNFGVLCGMIGGSIFVYLTGSNYLVFYFNVAIVSLGLLISVKYLKPTFDPFAVNDTPFLQKQTNDQRNESIIPKNQDKQHLNQNSSNNVLIKKIGNLPLYVMISVLLIHAFFDGGIIIFSPLKSKSLQVGTYWVFILGLTKASTQTVSTTQTSKVKDSLAIKGLYLVAPCLVMIWILIALNRSLGVFVVLVALSGMFQGMVYAFCMKITSLKAQNLDSSRPFALYQATMGTGRMIGQLFIGIGAEVNLNFGIWLLIIYDFIALTLFVNKTLALHSNKY